MDCLDGEYSLAGSTYCTRCEAGKYCADKTKVGIDCPAGQYSLVGQIACTICPAGFICPERDKAPTVLCGPGEYSTAGSTACKVFFINIIKNSNVKLENHAYIPLLLLALTAQVAGIKLMPLYLIVNNVSQDMLVRILKLKKRVLLAISLLA